MPLTRVHHYILTYLYDNLPEDESKAGEVSRKILFKSVNSKPRQIDKTVNELMEMGLVQLQSGFYKNQWTSIAITDAGMDYTEGLD